MRITHISQKIKIVFIYGPGLTLSVIKVLCVCDICAPFQSVVGTLRHFYCTNIPTTKFNWRADRANVTMDNAHPGPHLQLVFPVQVHALGISVI